MNLAELHFGEAFVDHRAWGLSRQEFRTAVSTLKKAKLLTSRLTSRGNAYRLTGTQLFEVLPCEPNHPANQPANHRNNQPANHKPIAVEQKSKEDQGREGGRVHERASSLASEKTEFEIPDEQTFWDFVIDANLNSEFADAFYRQREKDGWQIHDQRIRYWRQALVKFCEKCEADRTGDRV